MKKFLLNIFIILIASFIFSVKAQAENIRFIQVADVHYINESEFTADVLKSAVKDINNQPNISFVVFTGDNIGSPSEDNLRAFVKIVRKLKVPYYIAIGNHDVYKSNNLSKQHYFEILREGKPLYKQRSGNYKFCRKNFLFVIVDGAKEVIPGSVGYYREGTLKWLDATLTKNKRKNVVIFQHFPIEYPDGVESKLKTHKTYKVENYKEILDKHDNVLAVISGHFHVNSEIMKDGVYHISSPALTGAAPCYKIIDIVTTKDFSPIIYTQLREFEVEN